MKLAFLKFAYFLILLLLVGSVYGQYNLYDVFILESTAVSQVLSLIGFHHLKNFDRSSVPSPTPLDIYIHDKTKKEHYYLEANSLSVTAEDTIGILKITLRSNHKNHWMIRQACIQLLEHFLKANTRRENTTKKFYNERWRTSENTLNRIETILKIASISHRENTSLGFYSSKSWFGLKSRPKAGDLWTNRFGIEFIWVPEGDFSLSKEVVNGVPIDTERYSINRGFWLSKRCLTHLQWLIITNEPLNGHRSLSSKLFNRTDPSRLADLLSKITGHRYRLPTDDELIRAYLSKKSSGFYDCYTITKSSIDESGKTLPPYYSITAARIARDDYVKRHIHLHHTETDKHPLVTKWGSVFYLDLPEWSTFPPESINKNEINFTCPSSSKHIKNSCELSSALRLQIDNKEGAFRLVREATRDESR